MQNTPFGPIPDRDTRHSMSSSGNGSLSLARSIFSVIFLILPSFAERWFLVELVHYVCASAHRAWFPVLVVEPDVPTIATSVFHTGHDRFPVTQPAPHWWKGEASGGGRAIDYSAGASPSPRILSIASTSGAPVSWCSAVSASPISRARASMVR